MMQILNLLDVQLISLICKGISQQKRKRKIELFNETILHILKDFILMKLYCVMTGIHCGLIIKLSPL